MHQTYIDEHKVRASTIFTDAKADLLAKRVRPRYGISLISLAGVRNRLPKKQCVEKVVDEIHLC